MGSLGGLLGMYGGITGGFNIADGYPYGLGQLYDYTNTGTANIGPATPAVTAETIAEAVMLVKAHEATQARIKKEIEEKVFSSHGGAPTPVGDAINRDYNRRKLLLCAA